MKQFFKGLRSYRDKEKGKRVFVLANGPSALECDLSRLKDEVVIGMNASSMLEQDRDFHSNYYVVSDRRFLANEDKRHWALDKLDKRTVRFIRADLCDVDDPNLEDRTYYIPALERDGFSKNLAAGYYYACTTTMFGIQLAYFLGAAEIVLVGCDLRYPEESPRFYKEVTPEVEDPFTSVQIHNIFNARKLLEREGKRLVSCSQNSFLRAYLPHESFDDITRVRVLH